jgi:carboxymethylenebutenolidase
MQHALARYRAQALALRDRDGRALIGHWARPSSPPQGMVIVLHDVFGVTAHVRRMCAALAEARYVAFAVDLYRGRSAETLDEAMGLAAGLGWNRVAVEVAHVSAALTDAHAGGLPLAALGFGMGGAGALVAASAVTPIRAAVTYYGIAQDVANTRADVPLLGHFATHDTKCSPARVAQWAAELRRSGVPHALHHYEAENGFASPSYVDRYAPSLAAVAWERTLQFLEETLRT